MKDIEEYMIDLSLSMMTSFFIQRKLEKMTLHLSDQLIWMQNYKKRFDKSTTLSYLKELRDDYCGNVHMERENYHIFFITPTIIFSAGNVSIEFCQENKTIKKAKLCISGIWQFDKIWYLTHLYSIEKEVEKCQQEDSLSKLQLEIIQKAVTIDPLTKINNMQGFEKEVERLLKQYPNQKYAMIKFGIRDFRFVNRRYGYKMGDFVLKQIAKNLKKTIQVRETCGRMEKDIFAILYCFNSKKELEKRVEALETTLIDYELAQQLEVKIHFNIGIYEIENTHVEYVKDMLDKALIAQRNKSRSLSHHHYAYYEEWMMNQQYQQSKILEEAPKAMEENAFHLYIQPQFDLQTGNLVAGEALTRWIVDDGIRMPNEFIPVFEEQGLIFSFDYYMLEKICQQLKSWIEAGVKIYPISTNQSRLHIEEENYFKDFCAVIDRYEIPHEYIIFELTESAFVENSEKMIRLAEQLHEHHYKIAIDDFGTGYASLNLLSVVPADILKIDKSMLKGYSTNIRTQIIMEKMIQLAHEMGMKVICEGVEVQAEWEYLKRVGCDIAQGFLMGKPIEATAYRKQWLKNRNT